MENNSIKQITILEAMQMTRIEGIMAMYAARLGSKEQQRIRKGYKLPTGIWSGAKLRNEYLLILAQESQEPSTVRQIITTVAFASYQHLRKQLAMEAAAVTKKAVAKP